MRLIRLRWILLSAASVISCLFLAISCQHDGIPADQLKEVCFSQQVLPVFQNSCATSQCHDAQTAESGYVFTDYSSIMEGISPGDASKSPAYKAITSTHELMPPGNPLPIDKRTLIRIWIEQGARETDCTPQANTSQLNSSEIALRKNQGIK